MTHFPLKKPMPVPKVQGGQVNAKDLQAMMMQKEGERRIRGKKK